MGLINANKLLKVGVQQFDDQHNQLIQITNQLHEAIKSGTGQQAVQTTLQQLSLFTANHFKSEEELLKTHNYPDLKAHCADHQAVLDRLEEIQTQFKNDTTSVQQQTVMQFLLDWLTTHTKNLDKKYGDFLNSKGVY